MSSKNSFLKGCICGGLFVGILLAIGLFVFSRISKSDGAKMNEQTIIAEEKQESNWSWDAEVVAISPVSDLPLYGVTIAISNKTSKIPIKNPGRDWLVIQPKYGELFTKKGTEPWEVIGGLLSLGYEKSIMFYRLIEKASPGEDSVDSFCLYLNLAQGVIADDGIYKIMYKDRFETKPFEIKNSAL